MHQINRTVGFQEIAPCAPARVWFARDQKHPQPVTHAVDLHKRRIVAPGQFPRPLSGR